jgi:S1-C subfamily serine protease
MTRQCLSSGFIKIGFTLLSLCLSLCTNVIGWANAPQSPSQISNIPFCPTQTQISLPSNIQRIMESVVIVQNGATIGSGVIISTEGAILTAEHLLSNANQVAVYLSSGAVETGQVISRNKAQDIALIKLQTHPLACLPLRNAWLPVGSPIYSVGFSTAHGGRFFWSTDKIKGYRWFGSHSPIYIQTGLDLMPGNSGGPLLDQNGQVVGIISWKLKLDKHAAYSYGALAIPVNQPPQVSWKE